MGILGSTRFGFYENAKKQLSQSKGLANSGQLDRLEKAVCAFFAGIGVSFILVINLSYVRVLLSTLVLESKFKDLLLTEYTQDLWMLL